MEKKEITSPETGGAAPLPAVKSPMSFMEMIDRALTDPNFSADKLHSLIDANERVMSKQAQLDYDAAMVRLQEKLPIIKKDGKISFSGTDKKGVAYAQETFYARYEDIDKAIRPFLRAEGFSVTFTTEASDRLIVKGKLTHKGGHSETSSMSLPLDTSGSKNNLQGAGSSISYAKRYIICSMLNIITKGEDDDGAGGPITNEQAVEIDQLLTETGLNKEKFLKYVKADDVRAIKTRYHAIAISALKAKAYDNDKQKEVK